MVSYLEVEYIIKGTGPRQEIWEYEEGGTIMVEVYDDRVEISNPGGLLPVVAADFGQKSMSRNPIVFGLFTRMHVVEKVGSGVPRMRRLMKDAGLPEPKFDTQGFFTVTFMKRTKNISITNDTLNDTLKLVLNLIKSHPGITANSLIKETNNSVITIRRSVKTLTDAGLMEYRGSKKTGGYHKRY